MEIRKANPNDSKLIAEILVNSWRHAYKEIMPDELLDNLSVESKSNDWNKQLNDGGEAYVLIEAEEIIGVIEICRFRDRLKKYEHFAEIPVIYLSPQKMGQGYGFKLLEFAIKLLDSRGIKSIAIWVLEKNHPAIKFYRKMGFTSSGTKKEHPQTGLIEHLYIKKHNKRLHTDK